MTDPPLIAIVDDDESVRVALKRLCCAWGWQATPFESVQALFEAIDMRRPDCLVLDAHMPVIGGVDAQAQLRERGISIPAVIITGRDDSDTRARARAVGVCAYLCKPVDAEVLFDAISAALGTGGSAAA